ncbi:PepSY domain-containing protein [Endozoicomonas arenosclerae]|uniref:PepSY domain-containing protein n=1 Tax=Endozoicomonas arenosclerae TaxID=1633495 RepID=UPI000781C33E|nr:PepSY domain-containing protein [Endozoicomonas arenosclerae]
MRLLKEVILGLFLVSTAALAGQDDVIARLAIENAKIKPEEAIQKITDKYPGYLSEFGIDDEDGAMVYEFTVVDSREGVELELIMDAESGKIWLDEKDRISSNKLKTRKYQLLMNSGVTLQKAVEEAIKVVPGVLMEAELEQEKGIVFFEIELLTDKGERKVIVDLQSGKPIPVTR